MVSRSSKISPARFSSELLRWYAARRRDLPWRRRPTPYRVWVSEIMLQQTRVDVVIPYFERFLERFPTVDALARAPEDDVLTLWSGLGYYRRARSLLAGAKFVRDRWSGEFPREFADALDVPGVGPYTAGAILSIAYGKRVPVVDGNVERVLTRLHALPGDPKRGALAKRLRAIAADLLPRASCGDFNQALMELGATTCTPRAPDCASCPVRSYCRAHALDATEVFPETTAREAPVPVILHCAILRRGARYLLERTSGRGFLEGIWMFPFVVGNGVDALLEALDASLDTRVALAATLPPIRHSITYRRITLHSHVVDAAGRFETRRRPELRWARLSELGSAVAVSSLALKVRAALTAGKATGSAGTRRS